MNRVFALECNPRRRRACEKGTNATLPSQFLGGRGGARYFHTPPPSSTPSCMHVLFFFLISCVSTWRVDAPSSLWSRSPRSFVLIFVFYLYFPHFIYSVYLQFPFLANGQIDKQIDREIARQVNKESGIATDRRVFLMLRPNTVTISESAKITFLRRRGG